MQDSHRRRRTALVAPGSDERKARKALLSNADEVVLDLEDAVVAAHKVAARALVHRLVGEHGADRSIAVRVNALSTPWAHADLAACASMPGLSSIVLPKAETGDDINVAVVALGDTRIGVQALVETPRGVSNIEQITDETNRLESVIIGYADLGAALGRARTASPAHWLAIQDRVLVAARTAGIAAIDGPYLGIADDGSFRAWCEWSSTLGFDGKWVIHPAQVMSATTAFTPSAEAIDHARRVIDALAAAEASGNGAVQLDGQMLDEAVAVAARRVLAQTAGG